MCKKESFSLRADTVKQVLTTFLKFFNHKNGKIVHDGTLGLRMLVLLPEKPYKNIIYYI